MTLTPNEVFLESICLYDFLSFGLDSPIKLKPLNVVIGPNASGKSNFIHGVSWLKHHMIDIPGFLRAMGGKEQVMNRRRDDRLGITMESVIRTKYDEFAISMFLGYIFENSSQYPLYINEQIMLKDVSNERENPLVLRAAGSGISRPSHKRNIIVGNTTYENAGFALGSESPEDVFEIVGVIGHSSSALDLIKDPEKYALQQYISDKCKSIWISKLNNNQSLDSIRKGQDADLQKDVLLEDFSNLGLRLNRLQETYELKQELEDYISRINPLFKGFHLEVQGNRIYIHMYESDKKNSIPATRLSDGTLLFLCLATLLLDPNPPPLICLEEPEVGLHPGVIHLIAELLHSASKRTQIIVTTHSDILVDAIGKLDPGAVMICDRDEEGTKITRPDPDHLRTWMEKYSLGELWLSGELGGTP